MHVSHSLIVLFGHLLVIEYVMIFGNGLGAIQRAINNTK